MATTAIPIQDFEHGGDFEGQVHNDEKYELAWAEQAFKHADMYYSKLLPRVVGTVRMGRMSLTKLDDEIYSTFRELFPEVRVDHFNVMVTKGGRKQLFHDWMMTYQERLPKFSFGSLLRIDVSRPFGPENSEVVPRVLFYAVEITRNREGVNLPLE